MHWRPQNYWQPGTQVSVDADINGVPAGNGVYGQQPHAPFTVGDAIVSRVDVASGTR